MNKVILMGRLTRDPEVRYTQAAEPLAIAKYSLAIERRFKRDGEPDVDFINCVAFGKSGSFAEKYFHKGMRIAIVGHLQTGSYEKEGIRRYTTDVIIEEQNFADSKKGSEDARAASGNSSNTSPAKTNVDGFVSVDDDFDDDDIPF